MRPVPPESVRECNWCRRLLHVPRGQADAGGCERRILLRIMPRRKVWRCLCGLRTRPVSCRRRFGCIPVRRLPQWVSSKRKRVGLVSAVCAWSVSTSPGKQRVQPLQSQHLLQHHQTSRLSPLCDRKDRYQNRQRVLCLLRCRQIRSNLRPLRTGPVPRRLRHGRVKVPRLPQRISPRHQRLSLLPPVRSRQVSTGPRQ